MGGPAAGASTGGGGLSPNVMGGTSGGILGNSVAPSAPPAEAMYNAEGKRARVLYDYDAADKTELSLVADEVTLVVHV